MSRVGNATDAIPANFNDRSVGSGNIASFQFHGLRIVSVEVSEFHAMPGVFAIPRSTPIIGRDGRRRYRSFFGVGVDVETTLLGVFAVVVERDVELGLGVDVGAGRIRAGHVLLPVGPAVGVLVSRGVVPVGVETVPGLPVVRDAVAVVVHLAPGERRVVETREVVGVAVAIRVVGEGIRSGEVLGEVVETVAVAVGIGTVVPFRSVRIEAVDEFPPVGQAVTIAVDGFDLRAAAGAVPHLHVDVRHGVHERKHVGEDGDVVVDAVPVEPAREQGGMHLVGVRDGGAVEHPVRVHRVADAVLPHVERPVRGKRGGHDVDEALVGAGDQGVVHPVERGATAIGLHRPIVLVPVRDEAAHVDGGLLRQVRHRVFDVRYVGVVGVPVGAVRRVEPPRNEVRQGRRGIRIPARRGPERGRAGARHRVVVPSKRGRSGVRREEREQFRLRQAIRAVVRGNDIRKVVERVVVDEALRNVLGQRGAGEEVGADAAAAGRPAREFPLEAIMVDL